MRKLFSYRAFGGAALLLALGSRLAWADGPEGPSTPVTITATTVGGLMINAGAEVLTLVPLLSVIAYTMAVWLAWTAIRKFNAATQGQLPYSDALMRTAGATFLAALPWAVTTVLNSMGITADQYLMTGKGATVTMNTSGTNMGLDSLMANFVGNIYAPAKKLMLFGCYTFGILSGIIGLKKLADAGKGGNNPSVTGSAIAFLVGGAALIAMAQMMETMTTSLFGTNSTGIFTTLSFVPAGIPSTQATNVFAALFNFVEIIGWIAFIRGIIIMRNIAEGKSNRTPGQAVIFLVAGAIAVNMYGFIRALQTTLGISLVT